MSPTKKFDIKVGQEFELANGQDMWKDDLSGVFLLAPGKYSISRPKDTDYRTQLDWYNSTRFEKGKNSFIKEHPGKTSFKITPEMKTDNILIALEKGTLSLKGKNKELPGIKEPKKLFKTDFAGNIVYDGPNKNIYQILQKSEKKITETIKEIKDLTLLEIFKDMEMRGWNPTASPRGFVINLIEKQMNENSIGVSRVIEEELEVEKVNN